MENRDYVAEPISLQILQALYNVDTSTVLLQSESQAKGKHITINQTKRQYIVADTRLQGGAIIMPNDPA